MGVLGVVMVALPLKGVDFFYTKNMYRMRVLLDEVVLGVVWGSWGRTVERHELKSISIRAG